MVALAGGDDEDRDGRLTVERSLVPGTQQPELLVSVDRKLNVAGTAKNGRTVGLRCVDAQKPQGVRRPGGLAVPRGTELPAPPHASAASGQDLARIASCRLTGTTVALTGRMRLRN